MALRFEWLGIAEASVDDGRGVPVLVGLNQNVVIADTFPIQVRRAIVIILVDEGEPALDLESHLSIALAVTAPDGKTIMSTTQSANVGEKKWPDMPGGINLTAQVQVSLGKPGIYTITCSARADDDEESVEAQKELYVVEG